MTKSLLLVFLVALSLSGEAFARGGKGNCANGNAGKGMRGAGGGMGGRMAGLSAEKQAQIKALREKHQAQPCNGDQACRDSRIAERDSILNSK